MTDRAKLITALRMFAAFANPEPAQAMRNAAELLAVEPTGDRAKLIEELMFVADYNIGPGTDTKPMCDCDGCRQGWTSRCAAAQIEADGKEIDRLQALVTAQDERDRHHAKLAAEAYGPRPLHTGRHEGD